MLRNTNTCAITFVTSCMCDKVLMCVCACVSDKELVKAVSMRTKLPSSRGRGRRDGGAEGPPPRIGSGYTNLGGGLNICVLNVRFVYVFAHTYMSFMNYKLKIAVPVECAIHYH